MDSLKQSDVKLSLKKKYTDKLKTLTYGRRPNSHLEKIRDDNTICLRLDITHPYNIYPKLSSIIRHPRVKKIKKKGGGKFESELEWRGRSPTM